MRTITIYSTLGGIKKVDTDVKTWGELKNLMANEFDFANLDATESINKTNLSHNDAALPDTEFVVFLRPRKAAGGVVYTKNSNYRDMISQLTDDDKVKIKKAYGVSYNMISKTKLIDYLNNNKDDNVSETEVTLNEDCKENLKQLVTQIKTIITNVFDGYIACEDSVLVSIQNEILENIDKAILNESEFEETLMLEKKLRELSQGF